MLIAGNMGADALARHTPMREAKPMVYVKLQLGDSYIPDVLARMEKLKISQNALAREMTRLRQEREGWKGRTEDGPKVNPSQVSRWFTPNAARRVKPSLDNVMHIEEAIESLRRKKAKL